MKLLRTWLEAGVLEIGLMQVLPLTDIASCPQMLPGRVVSMQTSHAGRVRADFATLMATAMRGQHLLQMWAPLPQVRTSS